MADEKIGGISVSIGGEDDALDAALTRAEQKIKAWVAKVEANYGINLDVSTSAPSGGSRGRAADTTTVSYGPRARGGATGSDYERLDRVLAQQAQQQSQQTRHVTQAVSRIVQTASAPPLRVAQQGSLNAAMSPMSYGDISRTVTAALTAAMRSPALPLLVRKMNDLSPARTPASSDEDAGTVRRARRTGAAMADTIAEKERSAPAGEEPFTSRRHPLQIVGEPKPGMNAPVAVEPAGLSRQRSAAMLAASKAQVFEPESELEQRRSEIERRRVASATALSVGRRNQAPTPGEQRLLDALYPPASEQRRARSAANLARLGDYPPGNGPEETVGFAPQRRPDSVTETSRPRIGTRMAIPTGTTGDEGIRELGTAAYAGSGGGGRYRRTEADVEERERQRVIRGEAQAVAAGRTPRTQASSLGGFLSGRKSLIAAEAALAAANDKVAIAQRRVDDPEVQRSLVARKAAVEELTVAQTEQAGALKKVESFSGFAAGARNLLGVTLAGAAFGVGLEGVNMAVQAV